MLARISQSIQIGKILFESHQSLSFDYEVSCKEIDYLLSSSSQIDGWRGGRIVGGGFGGCTINLVDNRIIEKYSINKQIIAVPDRDKASKKFVNRIRCEK